MSISNSIKGNASVEGISNGVNTLVVSCSPHLHKRESAQKIMWAVFLSLLPSGIAAAILFGARAVWIIFLGVITAVITEAALQLISKKKVAVSDGSAVLTGLLLAYNLSPASPWWLVVIGSFFSIAIGKQIFGGLGQNIFNPALVGRVFLMASWPKHMTTFIEPLSRGVSFAKSFGCDTISAATPLALLKEAKPITHITYMDLFLGKHGGCIGEVCIAALLAGALFLLLKKYISWHIPITYIATTAFFTYIFGPKGLFSGDWLFTILSGGLVLGAFFMATDYVTSPLTRKGQLIFGVGCGTLTAVIRLWGGYPEGVSYAILIMNAATPIIDRYTRNRIFGR